VAKAIVDDGEAFGSISFRSYIGCYSNFPCVLLLGRYSVVHVHWCFLLLLSWLELGAGDDRCNILTKYILLMLALFS
jgi:hypothetical protein